MPFVYLVSRIQNGRSYLTRLVTVTQEGDSNAVFTCTCSFKKPEANLVDLQDKVDLWREYKSVLGDRKPGDFEEVPGMGKCSSYGPDTDLRHYMLTYR